MSDIYDLFLLSVIFLKIGFFAFGGGWAIVGMIQKELVGAGFLTIEEFYNAVSISQITPGPIAINLATYTGYKIHGIPGAVVATLALLVPPLLILIFVGVFSRLFIKDTDKLVKSLGAGTILLMSFSLLQLSSRSVKDPAAYLLVFVSYMMFSKTKINPIIVIIMTGLIGIIVYYTLNLIIAPLLSGFY